MPRHCDGSKNTCSLSHIQPLGPTFCQGFRSRAARSYLYPQNFRWLSIDWCCLSSMDDICKWLNNRNLPEMTTSKHPDLDICTYILGRTHSSCNANGYNQTLETTMQLSVRDLRSDSGICLLNSGKERKQRIRIISLNGHAHRLWFVRSVVSWKYFSSKRALSPATYVCHI